MFTLHTLHLLLDDSKGPYYDALMTNVKNIYKAVANNTGILQQTFEQTASESRKTNAILYGLEEKSNSTTIACLQEFMSAECFTKAMKPVSVFTLGAKKDNTYRPNKVKFIDAQTK